MLALFERWILEALQPHFNAKLGWYYQFILLSNNPIYMKIRERYAVA